MVWSGCVAGPLPHGGLDVDCMALRQRWAAAAVYDVPLPLWPAVARPSAMCCAVASQRRRRMGLPDGDVDPALEELSDGEYEFDEVRIALRDSSNAEPCLQAQCRMPCHTSLLGAWALGRAMVVPACPGARGAKGGARAAGRVLGSARGGRGARWAGPFLECEPAWRLGPCRWGSSPCGGSQRRAASPAPVHECPACGVQTSHAERPPCLLAKIVVSCRRHVRCAVRRRRVRDAAGAGAGGQARAGGPLGSQRRGGPPGQADELL